MRVFAIDRRMVALMLVASGCGRVEVASRAQAYTQQCPSESVEGLDVYAGDGTVDWSKVATSGRRFAFIKATQGDYNTQSTFPANWSGAAAAGLLRSPYHFFDATVDGVTQAQWFLSALANSGGLKSGDLPPLLDLECPTASTQSGSDSACEYSGNSGWAPPATVASRTFDWLDTVEKATGRTPIIYSYPAWFGDVGFTDGKLARYPLFIATYATCAAVPAPWTTTVFWQYTATGTVPGLSGQADLDRYMGSIDGLMGLAEGPPSDGGSGDDAGESAGADAGALGAADAGTLVDAGVVAPDAAPGKGDGIPGPHQLGGCSEAGATRSAPRPPWLLAAALLAMARSGPGRRRGRRARAAR